MSKKVISLILCIMLLVTLIPCDLEAKEYDFYQVKINAGNGTENEKAIIEDGEIYILASSFEKYTRFEFDEENQTFVVKGQEIEKAFKKVRVNTETKKIAVETEVIQLADCFVIEGEIFLPLSQMLPILNAEIMEISSDVIYIANNELSMAELFYDFNINEYWYNISEEFYGQDLWAVLYSVPSYIFDTVVNWRYDRLDIVFESGAIKDYKEILADYLKDDELFHQALEQKDSAGELIELITGLNGMSDTFYDFYDWIEKIYELELDKDSLFEFEDLELFVKKHYDSEVFEDELKQILDVTHDELWEDGVDLGEIMEGIDFLYTYFTQVEDHSKMLAAVYGLDEKVDSQSGVSKKLLSNNPEYLAAKQVYELYQGNIIPEFSKKATEEVVKKLLDDRIIFKAAGIYELTAGLAGDILELFIPGDSTERGTLSLYANIANTAYRKSIVPDLSTEESTEEYRLSMLLTLISSRKCYQIMEDTTAESGTEDPYYQKKIEKIENMIKGLYLVAENYKFDTYEYFENFAAENRRLIIESGIEDNMEVYLSEADIQSIYIKFLENQSKYNYYAFIDIDQDGIIEMLAAENVYTDYSSAYQGVDLFIFENGKVFLECEDLYSKYTGISYDKANRQLISVFGGSNGQGHEYVYFDENHQIKRVNSGYFWNEEDESGNPVWKFYFNGVEVEENENEEYNKFRQRLIYKEESEVIFFNSLLKEPPNQSDNYIHSISLGTLSCYDLDRDGKGDQISVSIYDGIATIRVNDIVKKIECYFFEPTGYYTIVNLNERKEQLVIGLSDYGPSDDPMTLLFSYDGKSIEKLGEFDDLLGKVGEWDSSALCDGNGNIYATTKMRVFGTWLADVQYRIKNNEFLNMTDFYEFNYERSWFGGKYEITSKCEVILYKNIGNLKEQMIIPNGTVLEVVGGQMDSQNQWWVAFESNIFKGRCWILPKEGYFGEAVDTPEGLKDTYDAFDGIAYSD